MKLDTIKEAKVQSSIDFADGNSVNMKISEEGMAHIMSVLTNLYKNPELAVMREYFTNGLDAHIAVGQTKPVEVLLPTYDNPVYVVKDFGVGMSREDMFEIYSQYGASTKRDSNQQSGAFGLGAKSALTIATQFTVTSVKDGVKTVALVSKAESGINTLSILSEVKSDESHGTTVSIPIPDVHLFLSHVEKFFRFVHPSKFKLFGKDVAYQFSNHYEFTVSNGSTAFITKDNSRPYGWGYRNNISVVMGSVGYEVDLGMLPSRNEYRDRIAEAIFQRGIGISANIGDVDLTPSREGLRYTDKTKKFIETALLESLAATLKRFKEELDALEDFSAIEKFVYANRGLSDKLKFWRGHEFQNNVTLKNAYKTVRRDRFGSKSEHGFMSSITLGQKSNIFVTGFNADESRKVFRGLRPWFDDYAQKNNVSGATFILVDKMPQELLDNFWVKQFKIEFTTVDAQEIITVGAEAAKAARSGNKGGNGAPKKVTYPILKLDRVDGKHRIEDVEVDKIPAGTPYLDKDSMSAKSSGRNALADFGGTATSGNAGYTAQILGKRLAQITDKDEVILLPTGRQLSTLQNKTTGAYAVVEDAKRKASTLKVDFSGHNHYRFVSTSTTLSKILSAVREQAQKITGAVQYNTKFADLAKIVGLKDVDLVKCFEEFEKPENRTNPTDEFRQTCSVLGIEWAITIASGGSDSGEYAPLDGTPDFDERYPLLALMQSYMIGNVENGYQKVLDYLNDCYERLTAANEN